MIPTVRPGISGSPYLDRKIRSFGRLWRGQSLSERSLRSLDAVSRSPYVICKACSTPRNMTFGRRKEGGQTCLVVLLLSRGIAQRSGHVLLDKSEAHKGGKWKRERGTLRTSMLRKTTPQSSSGRILFVSFQNFQGISGGITDFSAGVSSPSGTSVSQPWKAFT